MEKKVSGKKTVILIFAVLAVIIAGCFAAVSAYVKKVVAESPPQDESVSEFVLPVVNREDAPGYISDISAVAADKNKSFLRKETNISVDTDSITYSGTETGKALVAHMLPSYLERYKDILCPADSVFGDRPENLSIPSFDKTGPYVKDFSFSQGEKKDENDHSDRYATMKFSLNVPDDVSQAKALFPDGFLFAETEVLFREALSGCSQMFSVNKSTLNAVSSSTELKADLLKNRIDEIKIRSVFHAEAVVDFTGDYSALEKQKISFDFTTEAKYSVSYAGIEIEDDEMTFKPGEKEMPKISAALNSDAKDSDYTLTFVSDNPEYVTVDDEFSVSAIKPTDKPVTVTATLTYLGNTYTDSIKITVKEGK